MFKDQLDIFEVHSRENTPENEAYLHEHKDRFSNQCRRIFTWLMEGKEITSLFCAQQVPPIIDTRARIRDLKKFNGVVTSERKTKFGKIWFCTPDQIEVNKKLI